MDAVNKYLAELMSKGWLPVSGPGGLVHTAARKNKPLKGSARWSQEWFTSTQVSNIAASHAAPWATFPVDMKGVVLLKKSGPNRLPVINCNPGIQLLS